VREREKLHLISKNEIEVYKREINYKSILHLPKKQKELVRVKSRININIKYQRVSSCLKYKPQPPPPPPQKKKSPSKSVLFCLEIVSHIRHNRRKMLSQQYNYGSGGCH
jgi:hypothetical protein